MFERFTERARRVIFFARYEASQYGSAYIETEHLLLGLGREAPQLLKELLGAKGDIREIRAEVERHIRRGAPIATSVEVPLAAECQRSLNLAAEESQSFGHRHIGTEHLLLGLLRIENSVAEGILKARGAKLETIRESLAKSPHTPSSGTYAQSRHRVPTNEVESFVAGLKCHKWDELESFFAEGAQFVDSRGKRWTGRGEIEKQFANLFAPYAKKNATFLIEGLSSGPSDSFVASVLWENVGQGSEPPKAIHRMTAVLGLEGNDWGIFLLQVTPVALQ
jgi:Clp amino terminal domain, pathogenicity island component